MVSRHYCNIYHWFIRNLLVRGNIAIAVVHVNIPEYQLKWENVHVNIIHFSNH